MPDTDLKDTQPPIPPQGAPDVPPIVGPQRLQCNLCGKQWDTRTEAHLNCELMGTHSEQDWETWRVQQGLPDPATEPHARFTDMSPPGSLWAQRMDKVKAAPKPALDR